MGDVESVFLYDNRILDYSQDNSGDNGKTEVVERGRFEEHQDIRVKPYRVIADAFEHYARIVPWNFCTRAEDEPFHQKPEDMILFEGHINIHREGVFVLGDEIWCARSPEEFTDRSSFLRYLICGDAKNGPELLQRVERIVRGYEIARGSIHRVSEQQI